MSSPYTLFEISWEVCNKVGGIHTVLSTKARTVVEKLADEYLCVGPWLLSGADKAPFDPLEGYEPYQDACRERGVPVRLGRWRIPGRPLTLLVEFAGLYEKRDGILAGLWEDYKVDSLQGKWDYVEPVLFGWAAGIAIEEWMEHFLAPVHRRAVVHAHEWMTSSSLLYLKKQAPSIGSVFTTHATVLGRALSSVGQSPDDGLDGQSPEELAETHGVVAKHSIEGVSARETDVLTTVSEITAREARLLHGRGPDPLTPNGMDLGVIEELAGDHPRAQVRARLADLATRFLGRDVAGAAFACISGRYEFHNKGIDFLLEACAELCRRPGRPLVLFVLVPAGNSGVKGELLERLKRPVAAIDGAMGLTTHNLFDEENDPLHVLCAKLGLANAPDDRVKLVQIPCYLGPGDGILDLPYEALLRAMDFSAFPSYYEPWGYTPQESLALGVPTVTTDYAGFGRWANAEGLGAENGVRVIPRVHVEYGEARARLVRELEALLADTRGADSVAEACRRSARRTSWTGLFKCYEQAYEQALASVQARLEKGVQQKRRPRKTLAIQPVPEGQRPRLRDLDVSATLPRKLAPLHRVARNFWWCWDPEAPALFRDLNPLLWEACGHNPVRLLHAAGSEDLELRATDAGYVATLERVVRRMDEYLGADPRQAPWRRLVPDAERTGLSAERPVAYFCAEYGIQESLRVYSGGLGVLAGDHLKSASDLDLPLVAVGLFYRKGYLTQRISAAGEQIALDAPNDPLSLPLELVRDQGGAPLEVTLPLLGRQLALRSWRVRVGRVSLYLLDSDTPTNREEDRAITSQLYGGEAETRLKQEIALGRGGVRLLRRLGLAPAVYHMNEGHAAFTTLERVSALVREGLTFEEARETVRATTLFTTHTPVPAGHDRFGEDLMRRYFSDAEDWVGLPWEGFFAFGQASEGPRDSFNMTYLALHFSAYCNGVSELHKTASRALLHPYWPRLLESEVPVDSITNGIHLGTWTHPEVARALGVADRPVRGEDFAAGSSEQAAAAVWRAKRSIKRELMTTLRVRLRRGFLERHDSPQLLEESLDGLREDALLIGFARRFAPYKRALLLFQDPARLRALLSDEERPVRVLVGGKAHPRDEHGKDILRRIAEISRSKDLAGRVFFVENYDMDLARSLVQGVDVWLNNPTRMQEASGTSGMKVAANGGLNLSIGDGWWPEAYDGRNGWTIADGPVYENPTLQDEFDSSALYRLLEEEIVPAYFDRDASGVPSRWLDFVRHDLATIPARFNTDRMVGEYVRKAYAPLARTRAQDVRALVQRIQRVRKGFPQVTIHAVEIADLSEVKVGDTIGVHATLKLGPLAPEDVVVELVLGRRTSGSDLREPVVTRLDPVGVEEALHVFEGSHACLRAGAFGYGIRVRPRTDADTERALGDLALWA